MAQERHSHLCKNTTAGCSMAPMQKGTWRVGRIINEGLSDTPDHVFAEIIVGACEPVGVVLLPEQAQEFGRALLSASAKATTRQRD